MIVSPQNLSIFFDSVSMAFNKALSAAPCAYSDKGMVDPGPDRDGLHRWLRAFPRLPAWSGEGKPPPRVTSRGALGTRLHHLVRTLSKRGGPAR